MAIDLRTCIPGDRLELRNGHVTMYIGPNDDEEYPHETAFDEYCDAGTFWIGRESCYDIIAILPRPLPLSLKRRLEQWLESSPHFGDSPEDVTDEELANVARSHLEDVRCTIRDDNFGCWTREQVGDLVDTIGYLALLWERHENRIVDEKETGDA